MIQSKFKLVQIVDRLSVPKYSDSKGLHEELIITNCSIFGKEEFSSSEEAWEFKSYKAHPDDYIIIQVF